MYASVLKNTTLAQIDTLTPSPHSRLGLLLAIWVP